MHRVRFAPSPTGFLHIGSARTYIFNWLYARHNDKLMTNKETAAAHRALRERINTELASYGQQLRRTCIVQTHSENPMMLPLRTPRVIERNITDLEALAKRLGLL
jgi:hypothetical protein